MSKLCLLTYYRFSRSIILIEYNRGWHQACNVMLHLSFLVTQSHGRVAAALIWVTNSATEFIFHLLMMSSPHYRKLPSSVHIVSFQHSSSMNSDVYSYYSRGPRWLTSALCNSEGLLEKKWEPALLIISRLDLWGVVGGERGGAAVVLVKPFPAFTFLIPSPHFLTLRPDFHSICRNESRDFNSSLWLRLIVILFLKSFIVQQRTHFSVKTFLNWKIS